MPLLLYEHFSRCKFNARHALQVIPAQFFQQPSTIFLTSRKWWYSIKILCYSWH